MQHALELYESQAFLKAEKAFIDLNNSHPIESAKYLCLISKRLGRPDFSHRYNHYLKLLYAANRNSEVHLFHKAHQGPLNMETSLLVLKSIWAAGDLAFFAKETAKAWGMLIEKKYYNHSDDLFHTVLERDPYLLVNHLGQLTSLIETSRHIEAAKQSEKILSLIEGNWPKLKTFRKNRAETLKSLYQVINSFPPQDVSLEKARTKLYIANLLEGNFKGVLTSEKTRLAIEFAILFKDDRKELNRLLSLDMPQTDVLKNHLSKAPIASSKSLKKLRPIISEEERLDDFEKFEKFSESINDKVGPEIIKNEVTFSGSAQSTSIISVEEEELLARIKARDPDLTGEDKIESLAHSLFGIGYYHACVTLINHSKHQGRLAYLKCQSLWEASKYLKLLDFSSAFSEELNTVEEKVPFWFLGAKAALKLGKGKEAKVLLQQIVKIDPTFRNAKELLRSETA